MKQKIKNILYWKNYNKEMEKNYLKSNYLNKRFELIKEISNKKMNNKCFDCRKKEPKYISINNAIFLCEDCSHIHKTFPDNISFIIDNNLNLLSNNYLYYLYYGGNSNLDDFINYVYPGLQNYSPEILYKTQAMIYYREKLKCKIEGKPTPISPNDIMAYKLVSEKGLINIREENMFQNKILNKDIINNYYNNYNNTYNTFNNYAYNNDSKFNPNFKKNIKSNKSNNNYCSLVNKAFFNEMNNIFRKTTSMNSKNIFKTKNKFKISNLTNRIDLPLEHSLTYRLNDSFNYSFTNRINADEPLTTYRKLNKSAFSEDIIESTNKNNYSPRYIKPIIRISHQEKYPLNKFYIEKGKLKKKKLIINLSQITKYNESIDTLKNKDKLYKQQNKICNNFKICKQPRKISNLNDNLSLELEVNKTFNKNELSEKINKNLLSYLYNDSPNNLNKNIKKDKNKNNQKIKIDNKTLKTNKNSNISYDNCEKIKPIKVNLTLNNRNNINKKEYKNYYVERIKKALEDKKEQEKLEKEASHNLLFDKKDNDLFNNVVYLKRKNY